MCVYIYGRNSNSVIQNEHVPSKIENGFFFCRTSNGMTPRSTIVASISMAPHETSGTAASARRKSWLRLISDCSNCKLCTCVSSLNTRVRSASLAQDAIRECSDRLKTTSRSRVVVVVLSAFPRRWRFAPANGTLHSVI
jgi:hypothetical protein